MDSGQKTRRLFFALWPSEAVRERLARVAREAVSGSGGRPVEVANWHCTIAFLGSIDEKRMPLVLEAAANVRFEPFRLSLDRIEHWAKPAVLCAVASHPPAAANALAQALREVLAQRGFTLDLKPWRAHLTLRRKVVAPHAVGPITPVEWSVEDCALVQSETFPQGPRYVVLERWPK